MDAAVIVEEIQDPLHHYTYGTLSTPARRDQAWFDGISLLNRYVNNSQCPAETPSLDETIDRIHPTTLLPPSQSLPRDRGT